MEPSSRFEFRVWAEDLSGVVSRLRLAADAGPTRESDEIYLAAATTVEVNVKVRAGLLDIKLLDTIQDGFERWRPIDKRGFPLPAAWLRQTLFPLWRLEPQLERGEYALDEFITEVTARDARLAAVTVHKLRHALSFDGCIAEVADVAVDGLPLQTAAIEAADLEALRTAVDRIGLAASDNTSYPRIIHDVLGWTTE